jgi:hypothetical protein
MEESHAERVVELLRARHLFASVSRRTGVYGVGVRVVIPDGREALWDNDGAAGLEAMVLRDGVLVGFVPSIPDSDDLTPEQVADVITAADYDAPVVTKPAAPRPPAADRPVSAEPAPAPRPRRGFLRRR